MAEIGERARIKEKLSPLFKDKILYPSVIDDYYHSKSEYGLVDKAWALMLAKQGLLSKEDCREIISAVDNTVETLSVDELDGGREDFYFNFHTGVLSRAGKAGGKLHVGRSRNDVKPAVLRMEVRRAIWDIMDALIDLQDTLLAQAEANLETVITNYTFYQAAQPTTIAHYYCAVLHGLLRDFRRFANAYKNTNMSPFGAAALSGTSIPIDREIMAELLGFDTFITNSHDAATSRDYLVEMEMDAALMMNSLSRVADDILFWCSDGSQTAALDGSTAMCSSIMPQKKSPSGLQYIRGKCSHSAAKVVDSLLALKNTAYTNVSDGAEVLTALWDNVDQITVTLRFLAEIITGLTIKKEKAYQSAASNFCTTSGLAEYIALHNEGVPFSQAHTVVANILGKIMAEESPDIHKINSELLRMTSKEVLGREIQMSDEEINSVLDPMNHLQAKVSGGTPKPSDTALMLKDALNEIKTEKKWLSDAKKKVADAYAALKI